MAHCGYSRIKKEKKKKVKNLKCVAESRFSTSTT